MLIQLDPSPSNSTLRIAFDNRPWPSWEISLLPLSPWFTRTSPRSCPSLSSRFLPIPLTLKSASATTLPGRSERSLCNLLKMVRAEKNCCFHTRNRLTLPCFGYSHAIRAFRGSCHGPTRTHPVQLAQPPQPERERRRHHRSNGSHFADSDRPSPGSLR